MTAKRKTNSFPIRSKTCSLVQDTDLTLNSTKVLDRNHIPHMSRLHGSSDSNHHLGENSINYQASTTSRHRLI